MCDAIYIGNTQQTLKKSNLICLLNNGEKPDSFTAHFEQHFYTNMSRTYLNK